MNPLWENLYDRFKDRRHGAVFLAALLAPFVAMLVLVVGAFALAFRGIARALVPGPQRPKFPPLSSDELRVARSKLMKTRDRKGV